jgi:membrane protein
VSLLALRGFFHDQCLLRAAALTFSTILSLVPFLAFAFAILKGFGVQNILEPVILKRLAAGSHEVVDGIVTYINKTNMASVGAVGLLMLVVTVITLLGTIEESFNVVWGVREDRPLGRKFSDYLSVVVSAPLLVLAATSITTTLQSQTVMGWLVANAYLGPFVLWFFELLPFLSIWAALIFVYLFMPNTRVSLTSAMVGGLFAGTLWQLAQWAHLTFQLGLSSYNAIYGTLAVLPVFMLWIYVSWLIALLGMEVVQAHQNRASLLLQDKGLHLSGHSRELLALGLIISICGRFADGVPPQKAVELASELEVPLDSIREILEALESQGLVVGAGGGAEGWLPARDPDRIGVDEVLETIRRSGHTLRFNDDSTAMKRASQIVAFRDGREGRSSGLTVGKLIADE